MDSKCLGKINFEIENGRVVTYINDEKPTDFVPIRARSILFHYLKNSNTRMKVLVIAHGFVQKILELDSFVTKELMFELEGLIFEDEELPDLSEYIPKILNHLRGLGLTRSKMNENLIRQILYTTDLVVLNSMPT